MNTYTLDDINKIYNKKDYFSKEQVFNFLAMWGIKETERDKYFSILQRFPFIKENTFEEADFLFEKIKDIPTTGRYFKVDGASYYKKLRKKIYHKDNDDILQFILDLNKEDDIIFFADFIKAEHEIICSVDFVEDVSNHNEPFSIFEGDVISTKDKWEIKENYALYVCLDRCYRKLLYTVGKGYIRNGEPDCDEEEYNKFVFTTKDNFKIIGNIYADASFLIDPELGGKE